MKKWYFSDNGNVTGPFNVNEAKPLLAKNSDLYGWNPSLSQWLPVTQLLELREFVLESKPATQVSKELINKFVTKKRDLNKKVNLIDDVIKQTQTKITLFEKEIAKYKNLTESLTSEVQDNIVPIDKKYQLMVKQLKELTKATEIAKNEIIEVVQEFGDLVLSKTSENTEDVLELNDLPTLNNTVNRDALVQVKKDIVPEAVDSKVDNSQPIKKTSDEKIETSNIATIDNKITDEAKVTILKEPKDVTKVDNTTSTLTVPIESKAAIENKDKKTFDNVKNRLKSVFKHKVEEPPMRLSDQLKQLEQEPKEELVFIDSDIEEDESIDSEPKVKKRRRRRF